MTLVACVDDNFGLQFHQRRQSQDRALREKLLNMVETQLYMSPYSGKMFGGHEKIVVSEDYLSLAGADSWVFAEDDTYLAYADQIQRIILFRWHRVYPKDMCFTFPGEWKLIHQVDFPGTSHEKITMEMYQK